MTPNCDRALAADNLAVLNKAGKLWSKASLSRATALFEREWSALVRESSVDGHGRVAMGKPEGAVRHMACEGGHAQDDAISALSERMIARMSTLDEVSYEAIRETLPPEADIGYCHAAAWRSFVASAVEAFTSLDLLHATRQLLEKAKGSFGLVMSHSLECQESVVIAARGQGMSIACYPQQGLVLWGSEVSATKVAMGTAINSSLLRNGEGASKPTSKHGLRTSPPGKVKIGPSFADISIAPPSQPDSPPSKKRSWRSDSPRSGRVALTRVRQTRVAGARRLSARGSRDLTMDVAGGLKDASFRLHLDDVPALEAEPRAIPLLSSLFTADPYIVGSRPAVGRGARGQSRHGSRKAQPR